MIDALQYNNTESRIQIFQSEGVPTQTTGVRQGALAVDTTNENLYIFSGSSWLQVPKLDSSGNATFAGNVTVEGTFTTLGLEFLNVESPQNIEGPGAVNLTNPLTTITTTGADAYTLADGTPGQIKRIAMSGDGGDGTLTPTTGFGYSTITFADVGDTVELLFVPMAGWAVISSGGLGGGPVVA